MSEATFEADTPTADDHVEPEAEKATETSVPEEPSEPEPEQEAPEPIVAQPEGQPAVTMPSGMNVVVAPPVKLQPNDPTAHGPWVKYVGPGLLRIMRDRDWKTVGSASTDYVEWNANNKKRQPVSRFDDVQLDYLLNIDGRFELDESV